MRRRWREAAVGRGAGRAAAFGLALTLGACGSQPRSALPPPAEPAHAPALTHAPDGRVVNAARPLTARDPTATRVSPTTVARLDPRGRTLELLDARSGRRLASEPAGVGPSHVASDGDDRVWVVDSAGNAVLQFRLRPRLSLARRVRVPGRPWAIAYDPPRRRLLVTRTAVNRITLLHTVRGGIGTRRRWWSVRAPTAIAVEPRSGRVLVRGADPRRLQIIR